MNLTIVRRFAAIVPIFVCSIAMASPWTVPSGTLTSDIDYTDGHNDTDKFGDPVVAGSFTFFPANFTASSNFFLSPDSASDTATVTLLPQSGKQIHSVHAELAGDYSILGLGQANYTATLKATNVATSNSVSTSVAPSAYTSGSGIFSDMLDLNLPSNWSGNILVELYAEVNAVGGFPILSAPETNFVIPGFESGSAVIQLKIANLSADTENAVVPLPAAVATFPLVAGVAGLAARKFRVRKA